MKLPLIAGSLVKLPLKGGSLVKLPLIAGSLVKLPLMKGCLENLFEKKAIKMTFILWCLKYRGVLNWQAHFLTHI